MAPNNIIDVFWSFFSCRGLFCCFFCFALEKSRVTIDGKGEADFRFGVRGTFEGIFGLLSVSQVYLKLGRGWSGMVEHCSA
jgi:hypothetical protein